MWIQTTIGLIDTKEIDIEENKIVIPVNEKKQIVETYSSHDVCEKVLCKIAYAIKQGKPLFKLPTQEELDKEKTDKESVEVKQPCLSIIEAINMWNTLADKGFKVVSRMPTVGSGRWQMLKARLTEYTKEEWESAIENVRKSDLLRNNQDKWFNFDWFIRPNNFPKVLDGNYNNKAVDGLSDKEKEWWKG